MKNMFFEMVLAACMWFVILQVGVALLVLAIYCRKKKVRCILSAVFAGLLLSWSMAAFGAMIVSVHMEEDFYISEMNRFFGHSEYVYEPDYGYSYDYSYSEESSENYDYDDYYNYYYKYYHDRYFGEEETSVESYDDIQSHFEEEMLFEFRQFDKDKFMWGYAYIDFDKQDFDVLLEYTDNEVKIKYADVDKSYHITMKSNDGSVFETVYFFQIGDEFYIEKDIDETDTEYYYAYKLSDYLATQVKNAYMEYENTRVY